VDPEVAQVVFYAITAIGIVVWLAGLQFLSGARRAVKAAQVDEWVLTDLPSAAARNRLTGSAEVDGQPSALADKAASLLAQGAPVAFGPVKIVEKTDDTVTFERLGSADLAVARWFRRGELRFAAAGQGRTRIDWVAELADRSVFLWLGGLFQVLGLLALVVGGWAIYTYVLPSPDPAVRWQSVQIVQAVHFLWPPFLFGTRYRRGVTDVAAQFEALANNLPHQRS
jgi:hypothetical protein